MTTTTDARCERTDLPASMCSHCRGLAWAAPTLDAELDPFGPPASPGVPAPGPWFIASYPGECSACGGDIIPGDTIRADGLDGYGCAGCGQGGPQ